MGSANPESLLVAVVGNSDVQIPGDMARTGPDGGDRQGMHGARHIGAALLRRLDAGEEVAYDVPLLVPIVTALGRQGQRLDRIVLVATDQPEGEPRRASDTLHYAQLVRRRLGTVHGLRPEAIDIVLYRENPADYGRAFPFMRDLFARLCAAGDAAVGICHLAPTGGTPALTAALLSMSP